MKNIIISLLVLLIPEFSVAQSSQQAEIGMGTLSCKEYLELPDLLKQTAFAWSQGFMTSLNLTLIAQKQQFVPLNDERFNADKQQHALSGLCLRNQNSTVIEQTISLFKSLRASGIVSSPE